MTVADLRRRMPNAEFYEWCFFLEDRARRLDAERKKAERLAGRESRLGRR